MSQRGSGTEYCRRRRDRLGVGWEARQADVHGVGDGAGSQRPDAPRRIDARRDALLFQCAQQLDHKEWVAGRGPVASAAKILVCVLAQTRTDEIADGLLGQRFGAQHSDGRTRSESAQGASVTLGGARGDDQHGPDVSDPPREIAQIPKRRRVCPVGIVNGDPQRSADGQIGREPVQPVQDRELGLV